MHPSASCHSIHHFSVFSRCRTRCLVVKIVQALWELVRRGPRLADHQAAMAGFVDWKRCQKSCQKHPKTSKKTKTSQNPTICYWNKIGTELWRSTLPAWNSIAFKRSKNSSSIIFWLSAVRWTSEHPRYVELLWPTSIDKKNDMQIPILRKDREIC